MHELLPGGPIGDEIPLPGIVVVNDEDKNGNSHSYQAESGSDAPRAGLHRLTPISIAGFFLSLTAQRYQTSQAGAVQR